MPNFHTHWLVAYRAASACSDRIKTGATTYRWKAKDFRAKIIGELKCIDATSPLSNSVSSIKENGRDLRNRLIHGGQGCDPDAIACFSAYMLGACGPDFWTLPSDTGLPVPAFASLHFDLGHYNRSHSQFEVSVGRVAGRSDLQAQVEQSYFMGMAAHFATDLIMHELVNVYAGAYNLLRKAWHNEQPRTKSLLDGAGNTFALWSTHNKVEHYWDSYIRYRWLGDVPKIWEGVADGLDFGAVPLGLPTVEGLYNELSSLSDTALNQIGQVLSQDEVKWEIEQPLAFPWVFCDRALERPPPRYDKQGMRLAGDLSKRAAWSLDPFIYDVVVHPERGAYPERAVRNSHINGEKYSGQMRDIDAPGGHSERSKLSFFSSAVNLRSDAPTTWNYLTYYVCPSLDKVRENGRESFYHLDALSDFISASERLARTFILRLRSAYASGNIRDLGELARFWNLDTGLGLQVDKVKSHTSREVITRLNFAHALEISGRSLDYRRGDPYKYGVTIESFDHPRSSAFPCVRGRMFPSLAEVEEPPDGAFLDRIRLPPNRGDCLEAGSILREPFFAPLRPSRVASVPVESASLRSTNDVVVADIKRRLTLELRVPVAMLNGAGPSARDDPGGLGLFLQGDQQRDTDDDWSGEAAEWLHDEAKPLDYTTEPSSCANGLAVFSTRLFVNVEKDESENLQRRSARGEWNNLIPFREFAPHYGRNYVVSTARKGVLRPTIDGIDMFLVTRLTGKKKGQVFVPRTQYAAYRDLSPTEQVFFSLYLLVKSPDGVYDMLSKERVRERHFHDIIAISGVGFVKIVLLYLLVPGGAVQFDTCYIDGIQVPVRLAGD